MDKAIETLITYSCETLRSKEMNTALSQLLGNHFYQSIASIKILEQIILALIQGMRLAKPELTFKIIPE